MPRVVVLGCGTGIGKTRVSLGLLRDLTSRAHAAVGLKPIETGYALLGTGSDALALAQAGSLRPKTHAPRYSYHRPVSPHLAARDADEVLDLNAIRQWVADAERDVKKDKLAAATLWSVIETAGGVFSPLTDTQSNFHLARELEPSSWVLVAADALGVLHDVSATLQAMAARGRLPDHLVLSAAREPDASTGGNAAELERLGIAKVSAVLARDDDQGIHALTQALLEASPV